MADGPLGRDAALLVVELERVDPGDPQVRERELGRRAFVFERRPRELVVPERRLGLVELPAAASEMDSRPRRLEREPELVELAHASTRSCSAAAGSPFSQRSWPIRHSRRARSRGSETCGRRARAARPPRRKRDRTLGLVGGARGTRGRPARPGRRRADGARPRSRCRPTSSSAAAARAVDPLPLRQHRVVGDRLLRERMAPLVPPLASAPSTEELLARLPTRAPRLHDLLVGVRDSASSVVVERAAEHGRGAQHVDVLGARGGRSAAGPSRARSRAAADSSTELRSQRPSVAVISPRSSASLQHLLEHERVALGARVDQSARARRSPRRRRRSTRSSPRRRAAAAPRRRRCPRGRRAARPETGDAAGGADAARRCGRCEQDQPGTSCRAAGRAWSSSSRVERVGPVDVVERRAAGRVARRRARGARRPTRRGGASPAPGRPRAASAAPSAELREQLASSRGAPAELGADPAGGSCSREVVSERLDERQVRQRELRLRAAAPEHVAAELARALGQLGGEARLSHPRLAGEQHEAPSPRLTERSASSSWDSSSWRPTSTGERTRWSIP